MLVIFYTGLAVGYVDGIHNTWEPATQGGDITLMNIIIYGQHSTS